MAERAHPQDPGFKNKFFGLIKSKYAKKLFERYNYCNKFIRGKKVLDIPCGVGWGTNFLKDADYVYGIDISQEAIVYAQNHYQCPGNAFIVGRMESIPLPSDAVDVLICLEGFEHVSKKTGLQFLKESRRVLKKEGLMILTCPILNKKGQSTGNPYHLYEYPEDELIALLNKNFSIVQLDKIKGPDGPESRSILCNVK